MWNTERKFGLEKGLRVSVSQSVSGDWDIRALEVGELAQLLDRKWLQRAWIVQELVLTKKAVILCGPDEVPLDAIWMRMRDRAYHILGQDSNQPENQEVKSPRDRR